MPDLAACFISARTNQCVTEGLNCSIGSDPAKRFKSRNGHIHSISRETGSICPSLAVRCWFSEWIPVREANVRLSQRFFNRTNHTLSRTNPIRVSDTPGLPPIPNPRSRSGECPLTPRLIRDGFSGARSAAGRVSLGTVTHSFEFTRKSWLCALSRSLSPFPILFNKNRSLS
jgi:hypothetical protein